MESGKKKHRQLEESGGKGGEHKGCEGGKPKGERGGGGEEEEREVAFTAAWTGVRDARAFHLSAPQFLFFPLSLSFFLSFFPAASSTAKRRRARKGTAARERSFEKLSRRAERSHNARVIVCLYFSNWPRRRSLVSQAFARLSRSSSLYERWATSLKTFYRSCLDLYGSSFPFAELLFLSRGSFRRVPASKPLEWNTELLVKVFERSEGFLTNAFLFF